MDGVNRKERKVVMKLSELTAELEILQKQAKRILKESEYDEYGDLSSLSYDGKNADALLLVDEYRRILEKLSDIEWTLSYLQRPVVFTDTLTMDESGRYMTTNEEITYTSGRTIEFAYTEEKYNEGIEAFEGVPCWRVSRVEHNGEEYYIVGYSMVKLEGLRVRVRR